MNIHCRLGTILADLKARYGKEYNNINFAKRVGISGTTLSELINNNQLPRLDTGYAIARELNMPIEEIWVIEEEE